MRRGDVEVLSVIKASCGFVCCVAWVVGDWSLEDGRREP
jgi:hypothetical protein